ncbi:hypothetical protein N0M98_07990 [Paenibacillus doosanensis]|uniref:hypothetical protein n=1 Tax=Paenibacillus konkukensis TaxID=2020716 RepID=UPI00201D941C|nr:hypothetical protein [Paenibacillus konkukensis]MCS7460079.1 hypothetical protein [Paenibacillus doosanensis]
MRVWSVIGITKGAGLAAVDVCPGRYCARSDLLGGCKDVPVKFPLSSNVVLIWLAGSLWR